jgi:hypothetical protein
MYTGAIAVLTIERRGTWERGMEEVKDIFK